MPLEGAIGPKIDRLLVSSLVGTFPGHFALRELRIFGKCWEWPRDRREIRPLVPRRLFAGAFEMSADE